MACSAMGAAVLNGWQNPSVSAPMSAPAVDCSWIGMKMPRGSSKNVRSTYLHSMVYLYRWADGNGLTPREGNAWGLVASTQRW